MTKNEFGLTLTELRDLMELRGEEGQAKVQDYGGPLKVCEKLRVAPNDGVNSDDTATGYQIQLLYL